MEPLRPVSYPNTNERNELPGYIDDLEKYYMEINQESEQDRKSRMLSSLGSFTGSCVMCPLGRVCHDVDGRKFDPHVFGTKIPSKWVMVGQNPGFNECLQGTPFVGQSGKFLEERLKFGGLTRFDFYITNVVKCYTVGNAKPSLESVGACVPILRLELAILRPKLIITLGSVAFEWLCPDLNYSGSVGEIVKSEFGLVYPIFHPSPMNMSDTKRKLKFIKDIGNLCKFIKLYREKMKAKNEEQI